MTAPPPGEESDAQAVARVRSRVFKQIADEAAAPPADPRSPPAPPSQPADGTQDPDAER